MNTRNTSLRELLFPQGHGVTDSVWLKIVGTPAVIVALASFGPDILEVVKTQIRSSIGMLLQMSLLEILLKGWKKYDAVSQALEKSRQMPDDAILQSLANHSFKSVHHPYIELYKDEKSVGKIEFESTVALEVEGVNLKIRNGEIVEILTGSCQGSVHLTFAEQVLSEAQTGQIALPGSIPVTQAPGQAETEQVARAREGPVAQEVKPRRILVSKPQSDQAAKGQELQTTTREAQASRPGILSPRLVAIVIIAILGIGACCCLTWLVLQRQ